MHRWLKFGENNPSTNTRDITKRKILRCINIKRIQQCWIMLNTMKTRVRINRRMNDWVMDTKHWTKLLNVTWAGVRRSEWHDPLVCDEKPRQNINHRWVINHKLQIWGTAQREATPRCRSDWQISKMSPSLLNPSMDIAKIWPQFLVGKFVLQPHFGHGPLFSFGEEVENLKNKKSELMLTGCAKANSSSNSVV